ncbi:hypothetical protein [Lysinibacillus sp. TE18511]
MHSKFIKMLLLLLQSFSEVSLPSDEEPNVFPVTVDAYSVPCSICRGKAIRHAQTIRRFRHGYAWHLGLIWIEMAIPRHRCVACDLTFTYDFGLGLYKRLRLCFVENLFNVATVVSLLIPSFTFRNRSLILSPTTFGDEPHFGIITTNLGNQ